MKRVVGLSLMLAIMIALCALVAHADAYANVKMVPFKGEYKKGDQFTIRFEVCDITNDIGLALAEFKVHFDKETLSFVSSEAGKPEGWNFENESAEIWEQLDPKSGDTFIFAALNPQNNQGVKRTERSGSL